jgi:hypothetical protein
VCTSLLFLVFWGGVYIPHQRSVKDFCPVTLTPSFFNCVLLDPFNSLYLGYISFICLNIIAPNPPS